MIQDQMEECPSDYTRRWSRMCSGWESSSGLERTWEDSRCLVPACDGGARTASLLKLEADWLCKTSRQASSARGDILWRWVSSSLAEIDSYFSASPSLAR